MMMFFLKHYYMFACLLPLVFGAVNFKKLGKPERVFLSLSVFLIFTEWFVWWYSETIGYNMFLYPFYGIIQYLFIIYFFRVLNLFKPNNLFFWSLSIIGLVFFVYEAFLMDPTPMMPLRLMVYTSFSVFILSLSYFYKELQSPQDKSYLKPTFIMTVSLMMYSLGNVFYFLLFNAFIRSKMGPLLQNYHTVLNVVFYIVNAFSFYRVKLWKAK
jgi:hypothetical protein